jgi:hypothetical protein
MVDAGDPLPDEIPPCPNCGQPGTTLIIVHEIVESNADCKAVENGDRGTA